MLEGHYIGYLCRLYCARWPSLVKQYPQCESVVKQGSVIPTLTSQTNPQGQAQAQALALSSQLLLWFLL